MNVALHGMEQAAGVRYYRNGNAVPGCPLLVRYADDLIALCHSRQQAEQVQARLAGWLEPRGLAFNQDKTKITHLDQGVDFLGFEIRRFGGKLLTKPSKDAMRQIRNRLSAEAVALRGANADAVIARLNPVITGWAAYYRTGVSSLAFGKLDAHMGAVAYRHPESGPQGSDLRRDGPRHAGRASRIPPHPRTLPPTSRRQQAQHLAIGPA
jgi:RNA-directed DNA polymerase